MYSLKNKRALLLLLLFFLCFGALNKAAAQDEPEQEEPTAAAASNAEIARRLANPDPLERQRAAEELARLTAVDQLQLVAGYRLQEKSSRVRLALDWAMYRMGRTGSLFNIVRELDSSRHEQAAGYLAQLDNPEPLYIFLERVNEKTLARLLSVLARLGDAGTLERIKPYLDSYDEKVAHAAELATREIRGRLASQQPEAATRPRKTGNTSEPASEPR
ncbi:MAG TPA: hypothetical protein VGB17_02435 [Pyrinomonadaceae bacterium]|jgi:hypothetical protein